LEKVKIATDKRSGPKYAFITFKHSVSVPYTIQLMNGIRLYDLPLRLQERNGSRNAGHSVGSVEAVSAQPTMGPPSLVPTSVPAAAPSLAAMHRANSMTFNHNISRGHAGLLRSSSEPEGLGTNGHESRRTGHQAQAREMAAGPYCRPPILHRPNVGMLAQNIASQLHMFNQANAMVPRNPQLHARPLYPIARRQHNHHMSFNAHGGFHRR